MEFVYWISLSGVLYAYLLFSLVMLAITRIVAINWKRHEYTPPLSIIVSVYNEEDVIREKIENALALQYDQDLLEILVVSDGSTDRTHAVVDSFDDPRVALRVQPGRVGKTECLNRVVPDARGEIVVFTDANSMFPAQTLSKITRNFADEEIGLVTGWTSYRAVEAGGESAGLYARLERITKQGESLVSSCVGADGAIFAIRKELYRPLEIHDINDLVIPLNVVALGKRAILDPEVFCIEEATEGVGKEFRRQVRITNRTLGALWRGRHLLDATKYGAFSILLLSHKVIRFFVPLFFMVCLVSGLILASRHAVYVFLFSAQLALMGSGIIGIYKRTENRLVSLCSFFLMTLAAQSIGWIRFLSGRSDSVWTPQR